MPDRDTSTAAAHAAARFTGVLAALEVEAHTVAPRCTGAMRLRVCGLGPERAFRAATDLVAAGASALVSWGSATALRADLAPGTLVLPARVLGANGDAYTPDPGWRESLARAARANDAPVCESALVTVANVLRTRADRQALALSSGAAAADMESAAIARVAREAGIPFLVVRAVSDGPGDVLPPNLAELIDADGSFSRARVIAAVWRHPARWPALGRLGLGHRRAMHALRTAGAGLHPPAA